MYILISVHTNGVCVNEFVADQKNTIENYVRDKGYKFVKKFGLFINDDLLHDYKIEHISKLMSKKNIIDVIDLKKTCVNCKCKINHNQEIILCVNCGR